MNKERSEKIRYSADSPARADATFSSEISTSALVELLIRKGIVTPNEILEAERQMRFERNAGDKKIDPKPGRSNKKQSRLKKWASKKRWSRHLTARLFGWEWKRAKGSNGSNIQE